MAKYIKAEDATPYLTKYIPSVEAVERSKIDKAIEEMERIISDTSYVYTSEGVKLALKILKRNIGE